MKTALWVVAGVLAVLLLGNTGGEAEPATLDQLGQDTAYRTVKVLLCARAGDQGAADHNRRLAQAYRTELFERFGEAEAAESVQKWMEYYRHNPVRGC